MNLYKLLLLVCQFPIICKNHEDYAIAFHIRVVKESALWDIHGLFNISQLPLLLLGSRDKLWLMAWEQKGHVLFQDWGSLSVGLPSASLFFSTIVPLGGISRRKDPEPLSYLMNKSLCLPKSNFEWARNKLVPKMEILELFIMLFCHNTAYAILTNEVLF